MTTITIETARQRTSHPVESVTWIPDNLTGKGPRQLLAVRFTGETPQFHGSRLSFGYQPLMAPVLFAEGVGGWVSTQSTYLPVMQPNLFMMTLARLYPGLPLRNCWSRWLWDAMIVSNLLLPCSGYNPKGWFLNVDPDGMSRLICRGVQVKDIFV